jgi:hypothetical protein
MASWILLSMGMPMALGQDDFKIIKGWGSATCGIDKPARLVIKDAKAWAELWNNVHSRVTPRPPVPDVDFQKHMVIAVFMGMRPTGGYSISVAKVQFDKQTDKLVVTVEEIAPSPGSIVIQLITQPYHIVVVPRTDKEVQFVTVKRERKPF